MTAAALGADVAGRFRLGAVVMEPERVHGGLLNRVWKLSTESGLYAVKELNLTRDWLCDFDAVFAFETAAWKAGVAMPRPLLDPRSERPVARVLDGTASVLVHEWAPGEPVPPAPVNEDFARSIGAALARVHRLDTAWPATDRAPRPARSDATWDDIARATHDAAMPWAARLEEAVPTLRYIESVTDEWAAQAETVVVAHRDVGQKNLLDHDGAPVILDWEASGPAPVAHELGAAALCLASGPTIAAFTPGVLAALIEGYRDSGGSLPEPGPHWFSMYLSNWRHFVRWKILRCLDGTTSAGPDLATAHQVVEDGLLDIPATVNALDRLTECLREACA